MDRFEFDSPQFLFGEELIVKSRDVKIYDGDIKTMYIGGEVLVTNFRLLWTHSSVGSDNPICLSLSLKLVIYVEEENASAFSFNKSNKLIIHLSPVTDVKKKEGPVKQSVSSYIKLSFKHSLDLETNLIHGLKEAVRLKKWESMPQMSAHPPKRPEVKTRTGIIGIERGIQEKQKETDHNINAAFQDLNKLMKMAKEMVAVAKNVSSKIREKQGNITEDETVQFKSYLMSLGIDDPVTRDLFSNETQYIENLARQISSILEQPCMDQGGMMGLADAYCRVNRARGLELLSPEDLLRACRVMERLSLPLRLRTFDSGTKVLQLSSHTDQTIVSRISELMEEKQWLTAEILANILGISVLLAKEHLTAAEKQGLACRDESIEGLKFYPNLFLQQA